MYLKKNEKELKTLIRTIRMYNQDIGMEFSIEKCETIVMKSGKRERVEEIELPNKDYIRREENKYLGILEAGTIRQEDTKEKNSKEFLRSTRKLLETKIRSRNLNRAIKIWAVSLLRY